MSRRKVCERGDSEGQNGFYPEKTEIGELTFSNLLIDSSCGMTEILEVSEKKVKEQCRIS